jgi:hypothetical protein
MSSRSTLDVIFALRMVIEKYRDMYNMCKTMVRCVAGSTKGFKVRVGLHQVVST